MWAASSAGLFSLRSKPPAWFSLRSQSFHERTPFLCLPCECGCGRANPRERGATSFIDPARRRAPGGEEELKFTELYPSRNFLAWVPYCTRSIPGASSFSVLSSGLQFP